MIDSLIDRHHKAISDLTQAIKDLIVAVEYSNARTMTETLRPDPASAQPEAPTSQKPSPSVVKTKTEKANWIETVNDVDDDQVDLPQLRASLEAMAMAGRAKEAKDIIKEFGVSRLPDVPKESWPQMMRMIKRVAGGH